jgi:hypothetical protein
VSSDMGDALGDALECGWVGGLGGGGRCIRAVLLLGTVWQSGLQGGMAAAWLQQPVL